MTRTAILVSSPVRKELAALIAAGEAPRRDYLELRNMLGGELLYPPEQAGPVYRLLHRVGGNALAMAWYAWTRRGSYDSILTDQEGTGLLLAMLFKVTRTRRGHVMISHYLTPSKKQIFYKYLRAQSHIDVTVCYSTAQEKVAREQLGLGPGEASMVLHPADGNFWRPASSSEETQADEALLREAGLDLPGGTPLVCSAGLEFRDYPTLIEAARQLKGGAHVAIAASSPWSKRKNTAAEIDLPENVHLLSLKPVELRALYRRSTTVAIPLYDVDFQAGSLVAYEAMACGIPVVITRTRGQADIVREGETGSYVPAHDPAAMAAAVNRLLDDPPLTEKMGAAAREVVERGLNLDTYLSRMCELVYRVADGPRPRSSVVRAAPADRG
jgi:glycosyltransferase involved in cell wall biosynthesis